jgi:hypothetical protein
MSRSYQTSAKWVFTHSHYGRYRTLAPNRFLGDRCRFAHLSSGEGHVARPQTNRKLLRLVALAFFLLRCVIPVFLKNAAEPRNSMADLRASSFLILRDLACSVHVRKVGVILCTL